MTVPDVLMPRSIPELAHVLGRHPAAPLVAGGTLEVPRWEAEGAPRTAVFLPAVAEMLTAEPHQRGAAATLGSLMTDEETPAVLRAAAGSIGGPAVRSLATIGGNIVAARPGCLAVALLALDGEARVLSGGAEGGWQPLQKELAPGAVLTRVRWAAGLHAVFEKVTVRSCAGPVLATVAVSADAAGQRWRVAAGGMGARPKILGGASRLLTDGCRDQSQIRRSTEAEAPAAAGMTDASYRRHLAATLVIRAVTRLTGGEG